MRDICQVCNKDKKVVTLTDGSFICADCFRLLSIEKLKKLTKGEANEH